MQLEHVLRNVQTDRGSLLHGRLLRWQFDTVTLAHRMPSGGVHPITRWSHSRLVEIIDRPRPRANGSNRPRLCENAPRDTILTRFSGGGRDEALCRGGGSRAVDVVSRMPG